jgi:diguanylate cyclase (GGDEF)-like protein
MNNRKKISYLVSLWLMPLFAGLIALAESVVSSGEMRIGLAVLVTGSVFLACYLCKRAATSIERDRLRYAEREAGELKAYANELEKSTQALTQSRELFRYAAYHDALTDLPNRNYFIDIIGELLKNRLSAAGRTFAVLHVDLCRFKNINDSLGHGMGDLLLSQVGARLLKATQAPSIVGRLGGDQFAILLPELDNAGQAAEFAKKIVGILGPPFTLGERVIFVKAVIGIAVGSSSHKRGEDMLRDADVAMHRAKEKKRQIVVFDQRMLAGAMSRMEMETDLRMALERNEFELEFQPILDLKRLQLEGFESLVRWNHPKLGRIGPDRFIPASEATGLIVPMTTTILESACRQLARWQDMSDPQKPLFVSVNISGVHFGHPALLDQLKETIRSTGIDPRSLKLEITETAVMENAENAVTTLRQIKDLGVQLSIDDFGTGYSSLGYLQRFPIDSLKIDRVFVRSMEEGRQNGEIVRAVIALADALNLDVIAEGIESIHQFHQLRILSCRYGQGYLFSEPMAPAHAESLLTDQSRWQNLVPGDNFVIVNPDYEQTVIRIQ